jgi:dTMP kinase
MSPTELRGEGCWIAFEGVDGCGKSTQVRRLAGRMEATVVREPGGSEVGQALRELVLHRDLEIDARCEVLLFAADRAQLVSETVLPALRSGTHIVSDRSVWSSVAYQGYARGIGAAEVLAANTWAVGGRFPDIVVLLDLDADVAVARLGGELDRVEREGVGFLAKAAGGLRDLADQHHWVVVDAGMDPDSVEAVVWQQVEARLGPWT